MVGPSFEPVGPVEDRPSLPRRLLPRNISGWVYLVLGFVAALYGVFVLVVWLGRGEAGTGLIAFGAWGWFAMAFFIAALWRRQVGLSLLAVPFLVLGLLGMYFELSRKEGFYTPGPRPGQVFLWGLVVIGGLLIAWRAWIISRHTRRVEPQPGAALPEQVTPGIPAGDGPSGVLLGTPTTTPTTVAAPGWYADPFGTHSVRWWDGTKWTDDAA